MKMGASAEIKRLLTTVTLGRTNSPKLINSRTSQKTIIASNGIGTEEVFCANSNQRVWPSLIARLNAWF